MATANPYVSFNSPVPYICLVCGSCHAWNGTFAPACLRHHYFHTQCFVCKIDFVFLAAAVNHFNAHSVAAMMGYRHFPPALPDELRNATVCPPTYLPNMTMLDHSPPPSPAVLLHMMSSHLAWLSDEVANLPVSSYDANQEARAGRLALADLAFRRQLATWYPELVPNAQNMHIGALARVLRPQYFRWLFQARKHLSD